MHLTGGAGRVWLCGCVGARFEQQMAGGEYPKPPPKPDCSFVKDMQLNDPGSKHTKAPVSAINEDACCVVCMEDATCYGAELYGSSCYVKTAPLPLVKQTPPPGVPLIACVKKNHTAAGADAADGGLRGQPHPAVPAKVPGDIIAALERAGALGIGKESVYYSTNLQAASVKAAQNASYWLNTSFTATPAFLGKARHTLIIRGLDYNATVYLNNQPIGSHAGPYMAAHLPISASALIKTPNKLAVLFHMPPHDLMQQWLGPNEGPCDGCAQNIMWDYLDKWKSMVGIGYDFSEPFWSIGIQEGAELVATGPCMMSELTVLPSLTAPYTTAGINASFALSCEDRTGGAEFDVVWTVESGAGTAAANATTKAVPGPSGRVCTGGMLSVHNPDLWWPNGFGQHPLYTLTATLYATSAEAGVAVDSISRTFGIRDLKHAKNPGPSAWNYVEEFACGPPASGGGFNCTFPDAPQQGGLSPKQIDANRNWTFQINGQRLFARGANWLPCDMRIGECSEENYDYLVRAAADSNMNFLRVWGGGGIEKQAFFDACDRHGVMVYQETMHSQSMPTRDVNFANEAKEVEEMINKISSHPSVVRYGWGNEYYGVNHSSNRFERQYEDTANKFDPTRRATHGSPVTWADRHGPYCFYLSTVGPGESSFPCYQQAGYEAYNSKEDQNIMNQEGPNDPMEWDEYGAAGASSEYTLTQIIPKEHRFPVSATNADYIFHRGFNAVGGGAMWLNQDSYLPLFGQPDSLATEVKVSQWAQNEGLRYANQAHRRHMPHRSMSAFWSFDEPWPNAAYGSVVDWFGEKKAAYYAATRAVYATTDVSLTYSALFLVAGDALPVIEAWVVSERTVHGTLVLQVTTTSGRYLYNQTWKASVVVGKGEMGASVKLPGAVAWDGPTADLAGEVVLVTLTLHRVAATSGGAGAGAIVANQLYTFGVLKPGSSVGAKMDAVLPMKPLLKAPPATFTVSKAHCTTTGTATIAGSCMVTVANAGVAPCLYIKLQLVDPLLPPAEPQFHVSPCPCHCCPPRLVQQR